MITARMDRAVQKAIAGIPEKAWVQIKYPKAIYTNRSSGGSPTCRSPKPPTPRSYGAWLAGAVIAHNLARAARVLAGGQLRKARITTIRTKLINIPARVSRLARTYTLHLPANSRREKPIMTMFDAAQPPPQAA